jgi:hypothetical protein
MLRFKDYYNTLNNFQQIKVFSFLAEENLIRYNISHLMSVRDWQLYYDDIKREVQQHRRNGVPV